MMAFYFKKQEEMKALAEVNELAPQTCHNLNPIFTSDLSRRLMTMTI